jgi:uncharacterized protein YutE (UPF0331/DUF86 family)
MTETQTMKVRKTTHQKLRLAAALTGESMIDVCERAIENELKRLAETGHDVPQKAVKNK